MRTITIAALSVTLAAVLPVHGADIASGTWVMNVAKSKPTNPVERAVVTITVDGDRETSETHIIAPDGKETRTTATFLRDGQEHPYSGGGGSGNSYDSYVARRVASHEAVFEFKKAGKVVRTVRNSYSNDGKSRTVVGKGTDAQGKAYEMLMVFDRQ